VFDLVVDYCSYDSDAIETSLQALNPLNEYQLPLNSKVLFEPGSFIDIGEPITEGIIDIHELLEIIFNYHLDLDGILVGTLRSLNKFQLLLVNSIQAIYQSQGVNISSKHIEIIVRQMTSKVIIRNPGDTPLLKGELIKLSLINEIYDSLKMTDTSQSYKTPKYEPILMSSTNSSLSKDGFLSAAGFQETKRILAKAAIEGSQDWLRGLKECIIVGRLIPAGSAFLNYKHYLDTLFFFKDNKVS
jgi:DNA-directed RNA polymerase subunit beta'